MRTHSVQPAAEQRLLPRLSLRGLLVLLTLAVLAAWCIRQALLGAPWALALVIAVSSLVVCQLIYAVGFLIGWLPAVVRYDPWSETHRGSPFGDAQLPPQILPPGRERP